MGGLSLVTTSDLVYNSLIQDGDEFESELSANHRTAMVTSRSDVNNAPCDWRAVPGDIIGIEWRKFSFEKIR